MRWINYHPFFIFVFAGIAPRLRKASIVRNHTTPVDFITDMYQSNVLRYTIATCQMIAQFVWMCSNVVAIKNDFNSALGMDADYPWITVGIVAFILGNYKLFFQYTSFTYLLANTNPFLPIFVYELW